MSVLDDDVVSTKTGANELLLAKFNAGNAQNRLIVANISKKCSPTFSTTCQNVHVELAQLSYERLMYPDIRLPSI